MPPVIDFNGTKRLAEIEPSQLSNMMEERSGVTTERFYIARKAFSLLTGRSGSCLVGL
jgi:hypothetical protein